MEKVSGRMFIVHVSVVLWLDLLEILEVFHKSKDGVSSILGVGTYSSTRHAYESVKYSGEVDGAVQMEYYPSANWYLRSLHSCLVWKQWPEYGRTPTRHPLYPECLVEVREHIPIV